MSQQAVVTNANRKRRCQIKAEEKNEIDSAWPKPKSQQAKNVQAYDQKAVDPIKSGEFQ